MRATTRVAPTARGDVRGSDGRDEVGVGDGLVPSRTVRRVRRGRPQRARQGARSPLRTMVGGENLSELHNGVVDLAGVWIPECPIKPAQFAQHVEHLDFLQ